MQCPHCGDPKGIIWTECGPEPCCDEIITEGPRSAEQEQRDADDRNSLLGSVL